MTAELYARGAAFGFAIAFALGPIGLLVIRRTIDRGWTHGLVSGIGVAAADATYGAIAAFGLTAITTLLVGIDRPLGIVGGAVLLVLGARSLHGLRRGGPASARSREATEGPPAGSARGGPATALASMYALTMTNPATVLSFAALFASLGAGTAGVSGALAVVAGVFSGSVAWWLLLTGAVAGIRTRLTPRLVVGLNAVSAVLIGGFGLVAITLGVLG